MIYAKNLYEQFVFYKVISLNNIANTKVISLMNKNLAYIINPNFNTRNIFFVKKNIAILNKRQLITLRQVR